MEQHEHANSLACLFCGEPERLELLEIWTDHEFMLSACCDSLHENIVREMADDPAWACDLLRHLGVEQLTGRRLRRLVDDGGCGLILDGSLSIDLSASRRLGLSSAAITRIVQRRRLGASERRCLMAAPCWAW